MPETPEQFWERARAGLQTPPVEEWGSWPFAVRPTPRELEPPVEEKPLRHGADGVDCCSFAAIWDDVLPPTPADVRRENLELVRGL